jgi:hypothetical protein
MMALSLYTFAMAVRRKRGVDSTGEISHREGQAYGQDVTVTVHLCNDDEKKKRDG